MTTLLPRTCMRSALRRPANARVRSPSSISLHRQQRCLVTVRKVPFTSQEQRQSMRKHAKPAHEEAQSTQTPLASQKHWRSMRKHGKPAPKEVREEAKWNATVLPIAGENVEVSSIYLRDRCTCTQCVDPSSKQKNFLTTDIPLDIQGEVVSSEAGTMTIRWTNDIEGYGPEHRTTISASTEDELYALHTYENEPAVEWAAADFESECKDITFDDYLQSDATLDQVFRQLRKYGLAFISNVPDSEECVAKIAERIGPVKNTLYGYTWDVRSVPEATNVAYTSKDLGFHMDLLPMHLVPQLQFLHCIRSSAKGGNSLFTDAHTAGQQLWREDPQAFLDLCDVPVTFHYDHPESHLYHRRGAVFDVPFQKRRAARLTEFGDTIPIRGVLWSPPFQGPFRLGKTVSRKTLGDDISRWVSAAAKFNTLIHQQKNIHQRLMKPGECVIFVNNRVLHARTAFEVDDAGKERWLRGCYVDSDVWASKERVLQVQNRL